MIPPTSRVAQVLPCAAVLLSLALVAAGCGSDSGGGTFVFNLPTTSSTPQASQPTVDTTDPATTPDESASTGGTTQEQQQSTAPTTTEAPHVQLGDGSLGFVLVEEGESIQIRSIQTLSGSDENFGTPIDRAGRLAVADYGNIFGFDVQIGESLDDRCSGDGGSEAAQAILREADMTSILGVLGTSCSGAAVQAAPVLTGNRIMMISGGNTSPSLTSDLQGNPNENYREGYYRTGHNDLHQGAAMARFVFRELGLSSAAAIHDGDAYTEGLAQAFADAFANEGGSITRISAVSKDGRGVRDVVEAIAEDSPEALFFPIFAEAGAVVAAEASRAEGLENTVLLGADGLLTDAFLALPQTTGMYLSGPDARYGDNLNQGTGRTAAELIDNYEEIYGAPPTSTFWAHGYDAATLLLDGIKAASEVLPNGTLEIDRQGIREFLNSVSNYQGIIGTINCDDFGDCGAARITVVQNLGGEQNVEASKDNVVFSYAP